jgi:hypothetical protein
VDWIAGLVEKIDRMYEAIEYAKKIGTYNSPDRSKQYPLDDPEKLKEAVHKCWVKIHVLEAAKDELEAAGQLKDKEIAELRENLETSQKVAGRYRVVNITLTAIITGLAWEGVKALVPWVIAVLR